MALTLATTGPRLLVERVPISCLRLRILTFFIVALAPRTQELFPPPILHGPLFAAHFFLSTDDASRAPLAVPYSSQPPPTSVSPHDKIVAAAARAKIEYRSKTPFPADRPGALFFYNSYPPFKLLDQRHLSSHFTTPTNKFFCLESGCFSSHRGDDPEPLATGLLFSKWAFFSRIRFSSFFLFQLSLFFDGPFFFFACFLLFLPRPSAAPFPFEPDVSVVKRDFLKFVYLRINEFLNDFQAKLRKSLNFFTFLPRTARPASSGG